MSELPAIFIKVLQELPQDKVVSKSMSGFLTAEQMIEELENETVVGKTYISDLLRVSRDLLVRKSNKEIEDAKV